MADIFLARSVSEAGVERHVVLKRVLAERIRDPRFASMFLDEARLAAQLQHPNIAQVLDIGKLGDSYFYTMEYVHGQDLRAVLRHCDRKRRPLGINLAVYIQINALMGLHHAHTRTNSAGQPLGIVHRDVTPSNVMISYEGGVKLLDFGVAKASERSTETAAGAIKGKIGYLSPEQARGGATIDRRSDVFSAGIVLHEMLTCRRLFKRDSDFNTMSAIVQEDVEAPSKQRSEVSPELDAIVMKALHKDPDQRYQSAADMIEALEEVAAREHFVLSTNALGRSMREMFGERPEPWLDLANLARDVPAPTAAKPVTVTSEPAVGIEVRTSSVIGAVASDGDEVELSQADLEAQLEQAPALIPAEADLSGPVAVGGGQLQHRSQWSRTPPPMASLPLPTGMQTPVLGTLQTGMPAPATPTAMPMTPGPGTPAVGTPVTPGTPPTGTPAMVPAAPMMANTPAPMMAHTPPQGTPYMPPVRSGTELVRPANRPSPVVIASVGGAVLGIVIVIAVTRSSDTKQPVAAATPADAAVRVTSTEPATSVVDAAVAVAEPPPADAALPPDAAPPTIAGAVAQSDWDSAVTLCGSASPRTLSREDRIRCGVAACNAHDKKLAQSYYASLGSRTDQAAVARTCQTRDIVLTSAPARSGSTGSKGSSGTTRLKDSCRNRAYAERNPLKCQK